MKTFILTLAAILAISGCSAIDRQLSTFEPLENNRFRFETFSDIIYPLDDPNAEATRMNWLELRLHDNNLCSNGYIVEKRKVVVKAVGVFGNKLYELYYYGRCK